MELQKWEVFSRRLGGGASPAFVAHKLREDGFDCVVGGLDLSIQYVCFLALMHLCH